MAESAAHRCHLGSPGAGNLLWEHGNLDGICSQAYFLQTPAAGLGLASPLVARGLGAGAGQRGPDPHNFQAVGLFLGLDPSCLGLIDIGVHERFGQEDLE